MKGYTQLITSVIMILLFFSLQVMADEAEHPARGYHNYSALTKALSDLVNRNDRISHLSSIGKTLSGKDIWMLQISGQKGPQPQEKQALFICGNIEADHVIGSEVAMGIAEYLISGYGQDKEVTEILDQRTFYILPRLNPDGAELFFEKILKESEGNLRQRDDDYDWQVDEDGAEDLNGDGMITLMRVKDKTGAWIIDKKDARLMVKKEPGTPIDSLFKIYPEGYDDDLDENYNEDASGGFNINRNFPHNFGYNILGYQSYPASEAETRAVIDFMNRYIPELKTQPHQNICGVLIFSKYDNLAGEPGIECGEAMAAEAFSAEASDDQMFFEFGRRRSRQEAPASPARDPQLKKTDDNDLPLFKNISQQYKKITGIENTLSDKPAGSMLEWGYFQYGVPTFSANLWSVRKEQQEKGDSTEQKIEKPENKPGEAMDRRTANRPPFDGRMVGSRSDDKQKSTNHDQQWLNWIDKQNDGKGFVEWQKFQHKQLGEVEIGGFRPYLRINPPIEQVRSLSESHAKFALYLADQFAEIEMDEPVIEKLSSNLFRLKIKVHNNGKLPYATEIGQRSHNINPIMVQLKFEDDENMKLFGGSKRYDLPTLAAAGEKEYKWVIISPPGKAIEITLWAVKGGGKFQKKIVLK